MTREEVIQRSAELRGMHQFREAIECVKSNLPKFNPDNLMLAYREMFLAAAEAGYVKEACEYAKKVLELEPGLPTALKYVAANCGGI